MIFPKIITFSGIDGSGKTTIAALLEKYLSKKNYRVKLCHIGAMLGTSSEPKKKMGMAVGILVFLKDYLEIAFHCLRSMGNYDIVIFDRFLYDSVVKITYKQGAANISSLYIFLISILSPSSTSFLLTVTPARSFLRDRKHSKNYHIKKNILYDKLSKNSTLIMINTTNLVPDVFKKITCIIKI